MAPKVSLLRYVRLAKGWRRIRVQVTRKGRGWAETLLTKEPILEKGSYQLCWYKGSRDYYKGVGDDLQDALNQRDAESSTRYAEKVAAAAGRTLVSEEGEGKLLADEKRKFIRGKQLSNKDRETVSGYDQVITEFLKTTRLAYADEVTKLDILEYCQALRNRGLSERTVMNNYGLLSTFLKHCGIDHKTLVPKEERPRKIDDDPEEYLLEDVQKFLAACDHRRHHLFFETLLKTGLREKELSHLEWADVDFKQNVFVIRGEKKLMLPIRGKMKQVVFRTKTRRPREVTAESALLAKLKAWREENPGTRFVFGTRSDLPDGHMLEVCKQVARKAGLNCGHCGGCQRIGECEKWFLHKFRATFATWSLQRGVDIRTVQKLLGHAQINVTARYLSAAKGRVAQDKLNQVFAGLDSAAATAATA